MSEKETPPPPHPVILRMAELLARIEVARARSSAADSEAEKARANANKPADAA